MGTDSKTLCIYCGVVKTSAEFSDEHIWPDALGGDYLSEFWRTRNVCRRCNSMAGVFVDGAFIRGWAGNTERGSGAHEYMSLTDPMQTLLPLDYLGKLSDEITENGEVADLWVWACGATIVHIRPQESEELWTSYLGGDPRAKKVKAGRAFIALASDTEYWIIAALASFAKHFKRAERYVVNMDIPAKWKAFKNINRRDSKQAADLRVIDAITDAVTAERKIKAQVQIRADSDIRFLCKVALAVGCQLFGSDFTHHPHGHDLRKAFRQANVKRRREIPIRGTGYFAANKNPDLEVLTWSGAWHLLLQAIDEKLALTVVTPSGRTMGIQVTDDKELTARLPAEYRDGNFWLTVPCLGKAVGPLSFPDYIAHCLKARPNAELAAVENARIDPSSLPDC
ncbi:HNH endonuclease [Parasphingorhabdus sp. DH2-15]|uniref:HNH endonuclease n=1 Tax=Parasphingorhabdus sp. DH2-15 TaxID=3444112 RepID=UPI003F685911